MKSFIQFLLEEISHKQSQLSMILNSNPMTDSKHTGIRSLNDIKTPEEAFQDDNYEATPDFTKSDMINALNSNSIVMYSSKPFTPGSFITPSRLEAQNYAGEHKIYSKAIPLNHVAWIDAIQGQYTPIS